MVPWKIAAAQMDCRLSDVKANLATARKHLQTAADRGARLVVFPECALSGYGFTNRADAMAATPFPDLPTVRADITDAASMAQARLFASDANFALDWNSMLISASGRCSLLMLPSGRGAPWSNSIMSCWIMPSHFGS